MWMRGVVAHKQNWVINEMDNGSTKAVWAYWLKKFETSMEELIE